jgi:hypothetical protein
LSQLLLPLLLLSQKKMTHFHTSRRWLLKTR